MALEDLTGTKYLNSLVKTNPLGTDLLDDADGHLRGIKNTLVTSFPNISGAVTATHTQLSLLASFTNLKGAATKSTTYPVVVGDEGKVLVCNTSGGAFPINLPAVATAGAGFILHVVLATAGNDLTITPDGAETINGAATKVLNTAYQGVSLICTGSEWLVYNEVLPQDTVRLTGNQTIAGNKTLSGATTLSGGLSLTSAAVITKGVSVADHTDTSTAGAITFDFADGNILEHTLDENLTAITLSNLVANGVYEIWLTQDAATARTVSGWSGVTWVGGSAPTMNTTLSALTVIQLRKNGSIILGTALNAG